MHSKKLNNSSIKEDPSTVLSKAFIRAGNELTLTRQELCKIIGISEASMSRLFEKIKVIQPDSKEGELALLLIRVYRSLDVLVGGNNEQAKLWFRANNFHLNGIPAELVQKIEGLNKVTLYLDAMRGKL